MIPSALGLLERGDEALEIFPGVGREVLDRREQAEARRAFAGRDGLHFGAAAADGKGVARSAPRLRRIERLIGIDADGLAVLPYCSKGPTAARSAMARVSTSSSPKAREECMKQMSARARV